MSEYEARESTDNRRKNAQLRLKHKISVLERWHQDGGPPDNEFCPKNMSQFLDWEDKSLVINVMMDGENAEIVGVFTVNAATADKQYNNYLKTRAKELMYKLATSSKPSSFRAEIKKLKAERDEANFMVKNVTNLFVEYRKEKVLMETEVADYKNQIKNLHEQVNKLMQMLKHLTPFRPKSV